RLWACWISSGDGAGCAWAGRRGAPNVATMAAIDRQRRKGRRRGKTRRVTGLDGSMGQWPFRRIAERAKDYHGSSATKCGKFRGNLERKAALVSFFAPTRRTGTRCTVYSDSHNASSAVFWPGAPTPLPLVDPSPSSPPDPASPK